MCGNNNKIIFVMKMLVYILLMLLVLSIFSFASVISDNDGLAFVTKKEFDDLKLSFDKQINNYNESIDNKIEGAIASYLNGVKLSKSIDIESLLNKVNASEGGVKMMAKTWNPMTTQLPYGAIVNFLFGCAEVNPGTGKACSWLRLGFDSSSARYQIEPKQYPTGSTYKKGKYNMIKNGTYGKYFSGQMDEITYIYLLIGLNAGTGAGNLGKATDNTWAPHFVMSDLKFTNDYWSIQTGIGSWTCNFVSGSSSTAATAAPMTIGAAYKIDNKYTYNVPVVGTVSSSNDYYLLDDNLSKMESQPNTFRFSPYAGFYYGNMSSTSKSISSVTKYQRISGAVNTAYGIYSDTCLMDFQQHPLSEMSCADLVDNTISEVYGSEVKMYEGIPLCKATNDGVITAVIKFKNQQAGCNDKIICAFRKDKFQNNSEYVHEHGSNFEIMDENGHSLTSTEFEPDREYTIKFNIKRNVEIWLKAYSKQSNSYFVSAETTSLTLVADD